MASINELNAMIREQARIRSKLIEIPTYMVTLHLNEHGQYVRQEAYVKRSEVLRALSPNDCKVIN